VFHVGLKESGVAGSPRTPCSNVNLDEAGKSRGTTQRGRLFDQLRLRQGNGYLLSSSPWERRIVFVVLIIGHLKRTLEVHVYGTLMTNYDPQSRLVAFRCWALVTTRKDCAPMRTQKKTSRSTD
jgi:hypothetical protein